MLEMGWDMDESLGIMASWFPFFATVGLALGVSGLAMWKGGKFFWLVTVPLWFGGAVVQSNEWIAGGCVFMAVLSVLIFFRM